jgi:hypothetical protein
MSVVFSLLLWILWDVAFSVYTEIKSGMTPAEWILAGSGVAIAVIAMVCEFLEREKSTKENADLHSDISNLRGFNEGGFAATGRRLDAISNASPNPEVREEIAQLKSLIQSLRWRTITPEQKARFKAALPVEAAGILWAMHCVPMDAEAKSYADQVLGLLYETQVFGSNSYDRNQPAPHLDKYPCVLMAKDVNSKNPQILKRAFDAAGIECELSSEGFGPASNRQFLLLRVGPKPK